MQTITLDLKKIPEVANFLADKEPGDEVYLCGSIKALDNDTCVVTITEIEDRPDKEEGETPDEENTADETVPEARKPIGEERSMGEGDAMRDVAPGEKAAY